MKAERHMLTAFILNLVFSVFECIGGVVTGSVAIVSDAVHDMGDAVSIGISCFLERKSQKPPDENHTYGYARYSVAGGCISTLILLAGSVTVICNAVDRLINPARIDYNGVIVFAVVGVLVNFCAAVFTRKGDSLNLKAVNLHMLEDVLGWGVVLVGSIVMRFTDFALIDPLLSIGVAAFVLIRATGNLREMADLFFEKAPRNIPVTEIKEHIQNIDGVLDVHHIHLWSLDGQNHYATMHVVTNRAPQDIKGVIKQKLSACKIEHVTLELETPGECCLEKQCRAEFRFHAGHAHHHHHD